MYLLADRTPLHKDQLNRVYHCDALELMRSLPMQSVDAIITDLPYGTTACSWDEIIPFEPMWAGVKRVLKPRGVFVTTASQPFTSKLVMSNLAWFKYEWVWVKNRGSNPSNAKIQPMKEHETILVFGGNTYYPQMKPRSLGGKSRAKYAINPSNTGKREAMSGFIDREIRIINPDERLPGSVLDFNTEVGLHPTQKPIALFDYLMRTYSLTDDVILDPCCGSGTTAIAARNLNRQYIVGDSSAEYVEVARKRLAMPYTPNIFEVMPKVAQL